MPIGLQLKFTYLQANDLLKEKHKEEILLEFYRYLLDVGFPKLKKFAAGMALVFGTNYVCELAFSKLKYVKSTHRTKLIDKYYIIILYYVI